jgi:hypothetical protein
MEELDRELDDYFQNNPESSGGSPSRTGLGLEDGYGAGGATEPSGPLTAILPKRAENTPINLILGNGDSFVVPEGTGLRPTGPVSLTKGADLGLGADPVSYGAGEQKALGAGVVGWLGTPVGPGQAAGPGFDGQGARAPEPALGFEGPMVGAEDGYEEMEQAPLLRERSPKLFTNSQKVLLLVLSVVAAVLVIVTLFMSFGAGPSDGLAVQSAGARAGGQGASGEGVCCEAEGSDPVSAQLSPE